MTPDRRSVLAGTSALAAAGAAGAVPPPAVTRILAKYLAQARAGDIPAKVRREGCRTLLNYVGVA
ncbi:MAG TPA: twin-arginine translocation signal domain-containing protein, partial [Rhizomicrobium sp.]|nr:twin-arginine translocation signal domain-containing protein [Rhizomicrobium sp.]